VKPAAHVLIEFAWLDHYNTTFFEHPYERLQVCFCVSVVVSYSFSLRTVDSGQLASMARAQ